VETVSRIMARLQRDGVIDAPRGGIYIRNRKQLQILAAATAPHAKEWCWRRGAAAACA